MFEAFDKVMFKVFDKVVFKVFDKIVFEVFDKVVFETFNKVVLKIYDEAIEVIYYKVYNRVINKGKVVNVKIIEIIDDFNFLKLLIRTLMCLTYLIKI